MKDKKNKISLIVHTKNEERNIKDCILSAKKIVDEIIVIDMSSSDRTIDIAKSLGARVISIPDVGFVDDYRNFGISKAKFEWILTFDADERITEKLKRKLQKIVKEDKYEIVMAPRKNIRFNKWIRYGAYWPDHQWIMYKKGALEWPSDINQAHILPILKGKLLMLEAKEENAYIHYNIENLHHLLSKLAWYANLEGSGEFFRKNKVTANDIINYYEGEFRFRYIEQKGYLDGMRGFISAKFREYFKFLEFAFWWERNGYPEAVNQKEILSIILRGEESKKNEFQFSKVFKLWRFYHRLKERFMKIGSNF